VKFSIPSNGTMSGGLTAGVWYYVVNAATDDFKVSLTDGGTAIDITSAGTNVMVDSTAPYGTDLIDALADAAISASSERAAYVNLPVDFSLPGGETYGGRTDSLDHGLARDDRVQFGVGVPTPLSVGVTYYIVPVTNYLFRVAATPGGPVVLTTAVGSAVPMSTLDDFTAPQVRRSNSATWRLGTAADWGTLSQAYYLIPDQQAGLKNPQLKPWIEFDLGSAKTPRVWRLATEQATKLEELVRLVEIFAKFHKAQAVTADAGTDRITLTAHGLQAGDQVVFGGTAAPAGTTAGNAYFVRDVAVNDFKVAATEGGAAINLTSAGTAVTIDSYRFQMYFELPPRGGVLYDCLNPKAATARYWRICIRSRWAETLYYNMLSQVEAYEKARHWWAGGLIKFDAATTTAALRDVARKVLSSYQGAVDVVALPAVPVSGDAFVIERSCPRTWNACCERRNWENYGGFLDLPHQMIIR